MCKSSNQHCVMISLLYLSLLNYLSLLYLSLSVYLSPLALTLLSLSLLSLSRSPFSIVTYSA